MTKSKKDLQRLIHYPSGKHDWKKHENKQFSSCSNTLYIEKGKKYILLMF